METTTTKKLLNGKVRYYDSLKGEGMIRDVDSGISYYIHGSAVKTDKRLNLSCPSTFETLNKNDIVMFTLHVDYKWAQVDYCEVVEVSNV